MFTTGASPDSVIVCKKRKAREGMAPPRYLGSSSWWRDDSLSTVKKRVRKIKFVKRSKMYNFICCFVSYFVPWIYSSKSYRPPIIEVFASVQCPHRLPCPCLWSSEELWRIETEPEPNPTVGLAQARYVGSL